MSTFSLRGIREVLFLNNHFPSNIFLHSGEIQRLYRSPPAPHVLLVPWPERSMELLPWLWSSLVFLAQILPKSCPNPASLVLLTTRQAVSHKQVVAYEKISLQVEDISWLENLFRPPHLNPPALKSRSFWKVKISMNTHNIVTSF